MNRTDHACNSKDRRFESCQFTEKEVKPSLWIDLDRQTLVDLVCLLIVCVSVANECPELCLSERSYWMLFAFR